MAKALIVVDMQRGFLHPSGSLFCGEQAREIIEPIRERLLQEQAAGTDIFFTQDTHAPDDKEFEMFPPHCIRGSGEEDVIDELADLVVFGRVVPKCRYSACVGGCATCATPWGAELAGVDPSGTLPHGLILAMGDTVRAAEAFDRCIDETVNRVVLVDTFMDEADESVRVAKAMADRLWGVRLDTAAELGGVTVDLVNRVRVRLDDAGHRGVRIVVSGGMDVERILHFRREHAAVDAFGVGSAISGALPVDFTADIKEVNGRPCAKRGRNSGLTDNHRLSAVNLQ